MLTYGRVADVLELKKQTRIIMIIKAKTGAGHFVYSLIKTVTV